MNKLIFVLANIGFLVSAYLLWTYITGAPIACSINSGCEAVRSSPYSHIFGLPQPFFGLVFYVLIMIFSFLVTKTNVFLNISIAKLLLILAVGGFLYSAYLTYLEAFVIKAFCTWCVVSAAVATLILALLIKENYYAKRS